jgi:hypothetical protein
MINRPLTRKLQKEMRDRIRTNSRTSARRAPKARRGSSARSTERRPRARTSIAPRAKLRASMLTFLTVPKPFRERVATSQHNAIASWKRVHPDAQIILFGDEEGIAAAASGHGVAHEPAVPRNQFGTPLLDWVFSRGQSLARHSLVCYANTDIVFDTDLIRALNLVLREPALQRHFLLVGRRTNLDVEAAIAFDAASEAEALFARARRDGELFVPWAIDYFVFPTGQLAHMPPFPVGRAGWDNWMIHDARTRDIPVIDATAGVLAIHQNHDYGHVRGGEAAALRGVETERNWQMLGPDFFPLSIEDATWILGPGSVAPARDARHLLRRLLLWPALSPRLKVSVRIARRLKRTLLPSARPSH